jgi:hypothetical protein
LEECCKEQGQLAEASKEGLGSEWAVVPMMMMITYSECGCVCMGVGARALACVCVRVVLIQHATHRVICGLSGSVIFFDIIS